MITVPISNHILPFRISRRQSGWRALLLAVALAAASATGCEGAEDTAHASEASGPNQNRADKESSTSIRESSRSAHKRSAQKKSAQNATNEPETPAATPSQQAGQTPGNDIANQSDPQRANQDDGLAPTMKLVLDGRPGRTLPFELPEPWVYPPEPGQPPAPGKWAEVHEPRRDPLEVVNTGDRIAIVLRPGDVVLESTDGEGWTPFQPDRPVVEMVPGDGYWWSLTKIDRWGHPTRVARSKDDGRTWELRMTGEHLDPLPKLFQRAGRNLVLATGEHLLWSDDTRAWHWIQPRIYGTISALWTDDPASTKKKPIWWAGGENSTVAYGYIDQEWTAEVLPGLADDQAVYDFGRSGEDGTLFAATERGLFARDGDDAQPWRRVKSLGGRTFYGVRFFSDQVGVTYGASGEFAATIDGGVTWTRYTDRALAALDISHDEVSAEALLDVNWRYAEPVADGLVLVGDDMLVVKVDSPYLE